MQVQVYDDLPGASNTRTTYFETRLRRALAAVSRTVISATAQLTGDSQGDKFKLEIAIELTGDKQIVVSGERATLAAAAAHAFECLAARLSQLRPHLDGEALLDDITTPTGGDSRSGHSRRAAAR